MDSGRIQRTVVAGDSRGGRRFGLLPDAQLTLIDHGLLSKMREPEWANNPYNTANGGMLHSPEKFATDAQAKDMFKRRLRYIAARWAAMPTIFAWEWWNEVETTPIADADLRPWLVEMTAHLKQYDPYNHPISTSYGSGIMSGPWDMPEIGFAQLHYYDSGDAALSLPRMVEEQSLMAPQMPLLLAEFSYDIHGTNYLNSEALQMRAGLWAAPFSGFASSAMAWWWDTVVDPHNLWTLFRALAAFMRDEDFSQLVPAIATVTPCCATALTLQNSRRALLWIHNDAHNCMMSSAAFAAAKRGA